MSKKEKTKKRIQGSISVLLVIILLPMLTFSAIIVDMSRINMARQMMSSAGDLAMNTALANYDTILKDVYGLFAMSQAEGLTQDQLGEELNGYFAKTLSSYGVVSEEDADDYVGELIGDFREILSAGSLDTQNFLELSNIKMTAELPSGSSLANASVMRKQILDYMKYRAPLSLGLTFLESLSTFEKIDEQNKVVEAQVEAQQSTQEVTSACQKLIKLIRQYDKDVVVTNTLLTGDVDCADGVVVPLEDYDTHVDKYLLSWVQNYSHINKLICVFCGNVPSVDGVYLKSLNFNAGELYIGEDGSLLSGANHGINVAPTLAGDTTNAQNQITQQIQHLNTNYMQYTTQYAASILPSELLTYYYGTIANATLTKQNEDAAIEKFIAFEKFLRNQSDNGGITYTQLKELLEQIAILGKYASNYEKWINQDISRERQEYWDAQAVYNGLVNDRDKAGRAMYNSVFGRGGINKYLAENYLEGYEDLDAALKFLGTGNKQSQLKSALEERPAFSGGYEYYYNAYLKSGDTDIYDMFFRWLLEDTSFGSSGTSAQKTIIKQGKKAYNSKTDSYDLAEFKRQMRDSNVDKSQDLYKLLLCLLECHTNAKTYKNNIPIYNEAAAQVNEAERVMNEEYNQWQALEREKSGTQQSVKDCVKVYAKLGKAYQSDAYHYNYYINAAKNTAEIEALAIQINFSDLISNLGSVRDDLDAIFQQIEAAMVEIEAYGTKLENWNTANTNYGNANGQDSFSNQTSADIAKAKTEYNPELFNTLKLFVSALKGEFDKLYNKLTESGNFTYGAKRIDQITEVKDLIAAISGTEFSEIVTPEEASQKLSTLYKGQSVEYVPYTIPNDKQLAFLSPEILQIQALKYLNSTYPENETLTEEQKQDKEQYEVTKEKLTGNSSSVTDVGGESVSEKVTADFGYTYAGKTVNGNLPSGKIQSDPVSYKEEEYKMSKTGSGDDERLNAKDSLSSQTGKSNTVLKNIGSAAQTAVDNLYILNYVFENFSYNTIVQDQINKDVKLTQTSLVQQMIEANNNFAVEDNVTNAKNKITTLSNYAINEKHNHLYGGEIEYILFGNKNSTTNVTTAKASIYAIRFGFNCIFAFTDSEIRNSTMYAGLAVQAATMGIVPYQVVQIVLQLALAAAESAIDLSAMNHGLSVAIIKTKDTWSLSATGAKNALKDAANAAAQMVGDKIHSGLLTAYNTVTEGLNGLMEAGTDQLESAVNNVINSVGDSAKGVLESVADQIVSMLMTEVEAAINEVLYIDMGNGETLNLDPKVTVAAAEAKVSEAFGKIRGRLDSIINEACGENKAAQELISVFKPSATKIINEMETKLLEAIPDSDEVDITAALSAEVNNLKMALVDKGNTFIQQIEGMLERKAEEMSSSLKTELERYRDEIAAKGKELTEEMADDIKGEIKELTDGFVDTTLKVNGTSDVADVKASPVSLFKFGYKDYLMLLTYISICVSDDVVLRTADVIQMNLQNANGDYKHQSGGSFMMSEAYTYVYVTGTADLDMFFMDLDIFANQVADEDSVEGTEENTVTKITYNGLLGY